jgi:transcriptional regulator with XRE-family HTH domain
MSATLQTYLREQRERLGISQNELARQAGVSNSTVSRLEAGKGPTSAAMLAHLAPHYRLEAADVLRRAGFLESAPGDDELPTPQQTVGVVERLLCRPPWPPEFADAYVQLLKMEAARLERELVPMSDLRVRAARVAEVGVAAGTTLPVTTPRALAVGYGVLLDQVEYGPPLEFG